MRTGCCCCGGITACYGLGLGQADPCPGCERHRQGRCVCVPVAIKGRDA